MTNKELLYVEDALGHEQQFQAQCADAAGRLQDAGLKACVQQMADRHRRIFQGFYTLL